MCAYYGHSVETGTEVNAYDMIQTATTSEKEQSLSLAANSAHFHCNLSWFPILCVHVHARRAAFQISPLPSPPTVAPLQNVAGFG